MRRIPLSRGALLIEILVAVSIFAALAAIGAQATIVSLNSNTAAGKKGVGTELLSELLQGVRAAEESSWQNLYGLTKGTTHYYATLSSGAWSIVQGDELVTVGTTSPFTRYFTVANVSRDPSTRDIETTYTAAHDDPATEQVTATVVSSTTAPLSVSEYFFRWRNKVCGQTAWSSSGSSGAKNCPDTSYDTSSNITAGNSLQLCSGGC